MISLLGLVGQNFLLCSSGNHSKFAMDKWAWIMWPTEVNTCVFMTAILERLVYKCKILLVVCIGQQFCGTTVRLP